MSCLWTKKRPFDKTTSSNDKTKVSWTEKKARKIFGTDDQNHGLTRFLLTKKHDQTTRPMSLVQKSRLERYLELLTRIILITLLRKLVRSYTPLELQKSRPERFLELMTRIMG